MLRGCLCLFVEGVMRSKRRCVLEKKQPYSGDEWCSGPDTEEDEEKPQTMTHRKSTCLHREENKVPICAGSLYRSCYSQKYS